MENKFSMVGYTGAAVNSAWWDNLIIDISGISHKEKLPALLQHDHGSPAGVIEKITKGSSVNADGYFVGEHGEKVRSLIEAGFPYEASVGIEAQEIEVLEDKETATVNGRTFTGPGAILRKTILKEISFVSLGRDADTSVSIAASASKAGTATAMQTSKQIYDDINAQALKFQDQGFTATEAWTKLHHEQPGLLKKAEELKNNEIRQAWGERETYQNALNTFHEKVMAIKDREQCCYMAARRIAETEHPDFFKRAYL